MKVSEQLANFLAKRAEIIGRMDTLVLKGATLQGQDEEDFNQHDSELASVDRHIERLRAVEARQAAAAAPVQVVKSVQIEENAPKGDTFVKFTKAMALSRGNPMQALEIAKGMNYGAVLITTETNLQYELYLTGLESRILARTARTGKRVPWEVAVDAN